jgi:hypothetical protein
MERKNWNKVLDKYIAEHHLTVEEWEEMNEIQKTIIQEIKKSNKRKNYEKLLNI